MWLNYRRRQCIRRKHVFGGLAPMWLFSMSLVLCVFLTVLQLVWCLCGKWWPVQMSVLHCVQFCRVEMSRSCQTGYLSWSMQPLWVVHNLPLGSAGVSERTRQMLRLSLTSARCNTKTPKQSDAIHMTGNVTLGKRKWQCVFNSSIVVMMNIYFSFFPFFFCFFSLFLQSCSSLKLKKWLHYIYIFCTLALGCIVLAYLPMGFPLFPLKKGVP